MVHFINWLSDVVWNQIFISSFLVIGLFYTIITKCVQVTYLKHMVKLMFTGNGLKNWPFFFPSDFNVTRK